MSGEIHLQCRHGSMLYGPSVYIFPCRSVYFLTFSTFYFNILASAVILFKNTLRGFSTFLFLFNISCFHSESQYMNPTSCYLFLSLKLCRRYRTYACNNGSRYQIHLVLAKHTYLQIDLIYKYCG
jgi:hypothetical protein